MGADLAGNRTRLELRCSGQEHRGVAKMPAVANLARNASPVEFAEARPRTNEAEADT
jgi:hypothetical protein